ncbi:MAG TPA: insulinase family protein [Vicinamibacterales bacterium]|nr:insulinase family protein [Vicinamibacterales bacterium]
MSLRRPLSLIVLLLTIVAGSGLVLAARQTAGQPPASAPLSDRIPSDPAVRTGRFANGLTYYVKHNAKPDDRAELRLVVNAGSVLEDEDQRGLAHFVEHMAFNGTRHFPKLDIVSFIESIGMRFGADLNASTSFDETIYLLQVPTDKPEVLDRALLVLEDWAHNVSFDPKEIEKERGVIMEEWRLRRGAGARLQDKQLPVLLADSRYAVRVPIGTTDVIQHAKPDRLVKFYKDWYRPDLMAVIAVGDFDAAAMEARVRAHFASIPAARNPKPRPAYAVPARTSPATVIAADPELSLTQVGVYNLMPTRDQSTIRDYRRQIVEGLFASMLSARFSEIAQKPDAPFLGASAGRGSIVRTAEASVLNAAVKDNGVDRGLEALFVEADRVATFGFTATELDRQKRAMARRLERAVTEKDNQESADLAAEYGRNFLEGEPIPGIVYENELYKRFLPEITLDEVNTLARTWSPDRSRVVMVSAPEKPGVTLPTEAQLQAIIAGAAGKATTAYADTESASPLVATPPTPGTIAKTTTHDASGITEWTLSNGVTVVLKPTTFKQDEIVFRAFRYGGSSLSSDADFVPASTAAQVVANGGLGSMSIVDLQKTLSGVIASAAPSISMYEEGLAGGGSPKDIETMFQLIYARFREPRADPEIFGVMREQTKAALANQDAQPEFAFSKALTSALYGDHPRMQPMTPAKVDQMDLDRSMAFYKARFADASGFTFVFVGSFDPAAMRPLVERYLASLPSTNSHETWKDVGIQTSRETVERRVTKGIEPKSQTRIVFTGPFQYDQPHRTTIRAMAQILEGRLRNSLREDLGGTYSVGASPSYSKIPHPEYMLSIAFGSDPARADALSARVFEEIAKLKLDGPTPKELSDTKETLLRDFEAGSRQNGYLLTQIVGRYQTGEDVDSFFQIGDTYRALTVADIQNAAKEYLNTQRYVKVVLVPEK